MRLPDHRTPAGRRALLGGVAVLLAVLAVVWYGWRTTAGQVMPTVTAYSVLSDASIRVEYDLVRPEGVAVTCRVSALDGRKGRVGTVEDAVPAGSGPVVHRSVEVRTSSRAVTGVVQSCVRQPSAG